MHVICRIAVNSFVTAPRWTARLGLRENQITGFGDASRKANRASLFSSHPVVPQLHTSGGLTAFFFVQYNKQSPVLLDVLPSSHETSDLDPHPDYGGNVERWLCCA